MAIRLFSKVDNSDLENIIALQEEWKNQKILPDDYQHTDEVFINEETAIVIELNGKVIGYSIFFNKKEFYEIDSIYISQKEKIYKGIGKELLEFTEKTIKSKGGKKIKIKPVSTKNIDTLIKYYRNLGYVSNDNIMEKEI